MLSLLSNVPKQIPHHVKMMKDVPTVDLSSTAEDSSYFIADILMKVTNWLINLIGQGKNETLFTWVYAILVFAVSLFIGFIVRSIVLFIVKRLGKFIDGNLNTAMLRHHVYVKSVRIVPALVFLILIQFTLFTKAHLAMWLTRLTWIYVVYVIAQALASFCVALWEHIDQRENQRKLPLRGLIQLFQGIIWIVAIIIAVAILLNKSPGSLLAGLGVFASVLMLIFKDSILGVVAGVQLSQNDSLHVGDWISIPGGDANGTVMEVSLTAVKIQNWDKTTSTVPPYNLVSQGFKNYKSMQESNTRRIQRSYMIDADSVLPVDDKMLEEFAKIPLLSEWIKKKVEQRDKGIEEVTNNSEGLVDGSIDTNLGIFRAYVKLYLDASKYIDKNSDCFVTTLAQTTYGIPLQLYCFTNTSAWFNYEAIQAAVFEHLAVMLYRFRLYTFEYSSGRDTILEGYLSPGKSPEYIYGMPYPFFRNSGTPDDPCVPPPGLYPPINPDGATATGQTTAKDVSTSSNPTPSKPSSTSSTANPAT